AYSTLFPVLAGGAMLVVAKWTLAALLILPQSVLLGATFPLMSAGLIRRLGQDPAASDAASGRVLGILYFADSIGAAIGVLFAGFFLIERLGLPGTLLTAAVTNILVAVATYLALRAMEGGEPDEVEAAMDRAVLGAVATPTPPSVEAVEGDVW